MKPQNQERWMRNSLECSAAVMLLAILAMPIGISAQDNPSQDHKPKHQKYKLIDMGTLGGAWSGFGPEAFNQAGVAVGGSTTTFPTTSESNGWPCAVFPTTPHGFQTSDGLAIDLGTLGGGDLCSSAGMMNNRGEIIGNSEIYALDPVAGVHQIRAVLWENGHIRDLGALGGGASAAQEANNSGQIVGFALNTTPDPYSFYYFIAGGFSDGTQTRAFAWQDGVMQDLGTLGGPDANALNTNERGQVAGFSYTNSIPNPTTGIPTIDPFLWENGTMIDLGTLGGVIGSPIHLNQRGQVIGTSDLAGDLTFHPFLWDRGVLTDLGTFGGDNGEPENINDAGDIVGKADLSGSQTHDGFLWQRGVMTDLGTLPGYPCSRANWINEQRQVVGNVSFCVNAHHAFIWEKGGPMVDLNSLIPPNSSLELTNALDINNRGEIAGTGVPVGCQPDDVDICGHAYLLIPDGDCDSDCQKRIVTSQNNAEALRQAAQNSTVTVRENTPRSPAERIRNMMRQRYHLTGRAPAPRD